MRLFSLLSHFGNSLAFILFVWLISFEPFNLIIVRAPLYKGCFFKFGVEVGVGESIEIAPLV
jgi:hypothetical protein